MATRTQAVAIARSYIGCVRGDKRHRKLVDIFNSVKPHGEVGNYSCAWCAISWTAWMILASMDQDKVAYSYNCGTLISYSKRIGTWVENDAYVPMPGDGIIYYWGDSGKGDCTSGASHVGMVESVEKGYITVIEGNKGSGYCGRRAIKVNSRYIRGFMVPKYIGSGEMETEKLDVDGSWGTMTTLVAQKVLGTYADGVVSGQDISDKKFCVNCESGSWEWVKKNPSGSALIKAIQKLTGMPKEKCDGLFGPGSIRELQRFLGIQQDGYCGPDTVMAFQKWLNKKLEEKKNEKSKNSQGVKNEKKPETVASAPKPVAEKKSYKVIDVSYWQKEIDWKKVKADGVVGAIIRYADGKTLDSYFDKNMKNAKAEGIHVGSYIFSRATTKAEAESEAERLFNACKPYDLDMPMYIDLEVSNLSKYANTVAQAFLNKMSALGGRGGVYANLNWWNNYLADTANKYSSHPFWIAQYNSKMTHKTPSLFGMWQYTSNGRVNGINGNVDMNHCYISYWDAKPGKTDVAPAKKGYDGVIPSLTLKKTTTEVREDAIRFAKWIASDNRFGYGRMGGAKYKGTKEYSITHSGGCHFCGTNASKISKAKKANLKNPEEWEYTYVCNPFVHAAYAHAGVLSMLKKSTHSWWISSYQNSSVWSEVKKPSKMSDLKAGDVCAWDTHFCLYIGNGKGAEATSQGDARTGTKKWADCIHIINDFSRSFKNTTHVFRYIGTVNSTALIKYGEVSQRVKHLQSYLNWYGIKLSVDGLFGDATLDAVKKFQKEQNLTVDGIVGSKTIEAMKVKVR